MFTSTQVVIPLALLVSVVLSWPITEDGISDNSESDLQTEDRIYGGVLASPGQYPHQASLRFRRGHGYIHYCGSSIISNRFVLTAAHCYNRSAPQPNNYRIVVGTIENNNFNGFTYEIARWIVHENYISTFNATHAVIRNDIALVQTAKTIEFNFLVARIALHRTIFGSGTRGRVMGWGRSNVSYSHLSKYYRIAVPFDRYQ